MLKQYRVREGKISEYIFELYHDGKLVNTEKVWASDKAGKVNVLENEGYAYGYTSIEIQRQKKIYELMAAAAIPEG